MITKEQLKAEIDNIDEADIDELYEVVKRFLQTTAHQKDKTQEARTAASGLCGIWQDDREAEEIIEEIISVRSPSRDMAL